MPITHVVHKQNYLYFQKFSTYKAKFKGSISIKNASDLISNHGFLQQTTKEQSVKLKLILLVGLQKKPALIYATTKNGSIVHSYTGLKNTPDSVATNLSDGGI